MQKMQKLFAVLCSSVQIKE